LMWCGFHRGIFKVYSIGGDSNMTDMVTFPVLYT
jgi:hypothetical protein